MAREKRVLVIDDQPRVLEVLRELLASFQHGYKYEISTAQSVDGALGILEREHFDLILLDMVLPGIGHQCPDPHDERRLRQPKGSRCARRGSSICASSSISSFALSRRRLLSSRDRFPDLVSRPRGDLSLSQ